MKIEHLRRLIEVVESGSMNEAAQKMYTARSSVSSSMKKLESELGGRILERHTRGIVLTPFGVDVYHQAKDIVHRIDYLAGINADDQVQNLSIASLYCSLAYEAFIKLYSEVDREHFTGEVEEDGLDDALELVSNGVMEMGVITLFADSEAIAMSMIERYGMEFHPILKRNLYAIVGRENPLYDSDIEEVRLTDLNAYPYIINYSAVSDYGLHSLHGARKARRADVKVNDLGCALRLVENTDGYLIETYDKIIYNKMYRTEDFKFIRLKDDNMTCTLVWTKRKEREVTPIMQQYIEILLEMANEDFQ